MDNHESRLLGRIKDANSAAYFPDLEGIALSSIMEIPIGQSTIFGKEIHRLKTYLAILLMRTMRDFTDTDSGVYKSHDAVDSVVSICRTERDVRKRIRKQIRRCLQSHRWQYDSEIEDTWTCVYCRNTVRNDWEGFSRLSHLLEHPEMLPVEADDGFPFSRAHISVARGHLLGCLCGLVRNKSWKNHRSYFQAEMHLKDFERLEKEILAKGNALTFNEGFSWDYDIPKGRKSISS